MLYFFCVLFEANWNWSVVGLNKRGDLIDCTRMLLDNINQKLCCCVALYSAYSIQVMFGWKVVELHFLCCNLQAATDVIACV
jgi:hypothetical protein